MSSAFLDVMEEMADMDFRAHKVSPTAQVFLVAQGHSVVHVTEYEDPLVTGSDQHNVPCAVCFVSGRSAIIRNPG